MLIDIHPPFSVYCVEQNLLETQHLYVSFQEEPSEGQTRSDEIFECDPWMLLPF